MTALVLLAVALAAEPPPPEAPATDEATEVEGAEEEATSDDASEELEEPEEPEEPAWEPKWPGEPSPDSAHYDLEQTYGSKRYKEGYAEAKKRLAANPDDPDLHWIVARYMYEVGELMDGKDPNVDKEAHYEEMLAICERGLELRPGDMHLTFARGVARGRLGTTRGVLSSLWMASDVEADWLTVANSGFRYASIDGNEILPCDTYHGLGIFYRLVPDAWIVKVLSGTRGSLDKSLEFLEKANKCSPGRPHIAKELGVTQLCIGTKRKEPAMIDKGKANLATIESMKATTEKGQIDKRHAKQLIADPSMACGYSRDGQQEIDEAKLKK